MNLDRTISSLRKPQPDSTDRWQTLATAPARKISSRDPRIDFLRGLALITIFIDHVPDNPLNLLTMRNFGFADAAELFVILAGISSMMAYGKHLEQEGFYRGIRRIALRCLRIYAFQIGLLLITLTIVQQWRANFGLKIVQLAPFFDRPFEAFAQAIVLHAQPASLNILPLYIVLLALFPIIYFGIRYSPCLTLAASAIFWLAANVTGEFNFTNWLDGQEWFFNPFVWQFLFILGMFGAIVLQRNAGELPRIRMLTITSRTYQVVALVLTAPWISWGISDLQLVNVGAPDKTDLSPVRLLNILAFVYLALSSPVLRRFAAHSWATLVVGCGKHSLEVFSFGTLLTLIFRLLFRTFGPSLWLEILVNVVGIGAMLGLARILEYRRSKPASRRGRCRECRYGAGLVMTGR